MSSSDKSLPSATVSTPVSPRACELGMPSAVATTGLLQDDEWSFTNSSSSSSSVESVNTFLETRDEKREKGSNQMPISFNSDERLSVPQFLEPPVRSSEVEERDSEDSNMEFAKIQVDSFMSSDEETPDNLVFAENPVECACDACDLKYLKTSIPSAGAQIIDESTSLPLAQLQRNTFLYSNGDVYEGEFTANQKHGFGMYFYRNGDTYVGEWRHNKRQVVGTFIRQQDGLIYDGLWKGDLREGFGIQSQKDGTRYCGLYRKNVKEGPGVLVYGSGQLYSGIWHQNVCEYRELLFQTYTAKEMVDFCQLSPKYAINAQAAEARMSILSDNHVAAALRHQKKANIHSKDNKYKHATTKPSPHEAKPTPSKSSKEETDRPSESGGFGRSLLILRHLSSALGIRDWSASMVAHFLRCCGHSVRTCRAVIKHDIDGKNISAVLGGESLEMVFRQLGLNLNDSSTLHCITITLTLVLKVRRRQFLREEEVSRRLKDKNSVEYSQVEASTVSTEELLLVKRIGEGGFGRVYMGKYYPCAGDSYAVGTKNAAAQHETIDPRAAAHNSNFLDAANTGDVMAAPSKDQSLAVDVAVKVFRPSPQSMFVQLPVYNLPLIKEILARITN
eukprot:GHVH01008167.1.p1 GENE.GHVH01008167.1~~GHVH01008167.1.p1  ORF type:complete len:618 (+),score=109.95 GHVH01008167.1:227-2080(+)